MLPIEMQPNIYWVGINDRVTELFEGLWPIKQEGVSYNSYLIRDQKNVLIDLSRETTTEDLLSQINALVPLANLDYVVINHMEPDHSGALFALRQIAPQTTIIGSAKAVEMMKQFYGITENIMVVNDGDTLSLGDHTLKFFSTPFLHWPETMMTYEISQQILFSCDAFGGFGALPGSIFDDQYHNLTVYENEALRYFTNIVSAFCRPVLKTLEKLSDLPVQMVAPSHGLIWRSQPQHMLALYKEWAGYDSSNAHPGVTLLYASMYGNTEKVMEVIAQGIASENVALRVFNISHTHISFMLPAMWVNQGLLLGMPTYEGNIFPPMKAVLDMCKTKHVFHKTAARFGSHAWHGGAQRHFEEMAELLKWDLQECFEFSGGASPAELQKSFQFGAAFARKFKTGV
jgi:flavorubredoxin